MYSNGDYLNYYDLNNIEDKIEQLTSYLKTKTSISDFSKKIWILNEFPYIQEIDRIEKSIDNLGYYFYKPEDWTTTKIWIPDNTNKAIKKSFSYQDINRWIYNLDLIDKIKEDDCTIWNGQSFLQWEQINNLDWEE